MAQHPNVRLEGGGSANHHHQERDSARGHGDRQQWRIKTMVPVEVSTKQRFGTGRIVWTVLTVLACATAAISPTSPFANSFTGPFSGSGGVCTFGPVTFGHFDLGSWENEDGTVVVAEPPVGTGHWVTDLPSLTDELQTLERRCDTTAEILIRRVSETFPGTLTHAEIVYDSQARDCKERFGEIYDIYTGVLCPAD